MQVMRENNTTMEPPMLCIIAMELHGLPWEQPLTLPVQEQSTTYPNGQVLMI